jgi:hypothetical protein
MSQTSVKEFKQRKNMTRTPKSLSNEFQIQMWKGKEFLVVYHDLLI